MSKATAQSKVQENEKALPKTEAIPLLQPKVEEVVMVVEAEIIKEVAKPLIVNFVNGKEGQEFRINEFIKSLYGIVKANEKPKYQDKQESRCIRSVLLKLQADGLVFKDNQFTKLGATYYQGEEQLAKQFSIDNINILVKK